MTKHAWLEFPKYNHTCIKCFVHAYIVSSTHSDDPGVYYFKDRHGPVPCGPVPTSCEETQILLVHSE